MYATGSAGFRTRGFTVLSWRFPVCIGDWKSAKPPVGLHHADASVFKCITVIHLISACTEGSCRSAKGKSVAVAGVGPYIVTLNSLIAGSEPPVACANFPASAVREGAAKRGLQFPSGRVIFTASGVGP